MRTLNFRLVDPAIGGSFRRSSTTGGESKRLERLLRHRVAVCIDIEVGLRDIWWLFGSGRRELRRDKSSVYVIKEDLYYIEFMLWLRVVGMVFLLVRVSRGEKRELSLGVRIRVSSRPQHPRVLCFPHRHRYVHEHDDNACFSNKLNRGIERMTYQIKYLIAYTMDR
ncbi:hypothetical protein Taro_040474 [Colocasia esculenta]|uniref:Uncharacterized protein n=1 Tax=Colocasia esculenta TaxID=4460 RepID=A0A843W928_COLES|nr:hypothetical protein [Colocasia esculenta]